MSVVNKMLKDLEQRDKQSVYEADYVPIESQSAKSRKLVVGVLVVATCLAIATWILLPSGSIVSSTMESSEIAVKSVNPPSNLSFEKPAQPAETVILSELDEASLISLESAKQADAVAATKLAEEKLAGLNREIAQAQEKQLLETQRQVQANAKPTNSAPDIVNIPADEPDQVEQTASFSVSSSNKSASGNRMLEQRIQLSLKNGDTPAALKDLNSLLALEPRNASARKRLASLEFAQGNPKRAAFLLDQGIKLAPADSSLRLMQARLLFRENRNEQALRLLNEHPENVIADNDLLSFRAALAEKQKEYTTSLQDYAVLLQRQPSNARWMLGLAISQDKQKLHDEAVITYKKVKSSNQLSAQVVSFVDGRLAALVGS